MLSLFKPKLIQFGDGKFAIKKYSIFIGTVYLWPDSDWDSRPYKYKTEDKALDSFLAIQSKVVCIIDDVWDL